MRIIYLVPVGDVEQTLLNYLSGQLNQIFSLPVKIGKPLAHPDYAYDQKRGQYKSDMILRKLQNLNIEGAEKILGVIDLDLYTPGLNFIFGQACIGGKTALIALVRLKQSFYSLPENRKLYYFRTLKEAVHELGHTFGLQHCDNPKCVMHFSNSLADTDYKEKKFCKNCLNNLQRILNLRWEFDL